MIVGVDIGTQSLKVLVVDEDLKVRGQGSRHYASVYPRAGWAEQDPGLWEQAIGPAIADALADAGTVAAKVRGLGLAGQLDGCVPVDINGRPLSPCLIWVDRRAEEELRDIPQDHIRRFGGVVPDPSHLAAKIRWCKRRVPEARYAVRYHQPVSYMIARLTGENVIDHSQASTSMLYNLSERRYEPALLEAFGIEPEELPRIDESYAIAGPLSGPGAELTGLPQGVPVAVGTGDDFSNPLGSGLVRPGSMVCCLGTAEVPGALDLQPRIDDRAFLQTLSYPTGDYFIENPGWLSGGAVKWATETMRISSFEEFDSLAAQAPAGADSVLFLPCLGGAVAPEWISSARACFYGLTPAHGLSHMTRAVLEGCAFAMRDVVERLKEMSVPVESIVLLGGGARSRLWAQIRADLSGLPVQVPAQTDTSPMGGAMLAAVAAGIHPDLAAAAALVGRAGETFEPDAGSQAEYDDAYLAYRKLFDCLKPMF